MILGIWSALEPGLGIIASSLATLRPFLRFVSQSARSIRSSIPYVSTRSKTSGTTNSGTTKSGTTKSKDSKFSDKFNFLFSATENAFIEQQNTQATLTGMEEQMHDIKPTGGVVQTQSTMSQPEISELAMPLPHAIIPSVHISNQALPSPVPNFSRPQVGMTRPPLIAITPSGGAEQNLRRDGREGLPLGLFGLSTTEAGAGDDSDSDSSLGNWKNHRVP
jgi:hypothetical protein